jgi:hypothetical protein
MWWIHQMNFVPKGAVNLNSTIQEACKNLVDELRSAIPAMPERQELLAFDVYKNEWYSAAAMATANIREPIIGEALDLLTWGCGPPLLPARLCDESQAWASSVHWTSTPRNRPADLAAYAKSVKDGFGPILLDFGNLPGVAGAPANIAEPEFATYLARHARIALERQAVYYHTAKSGYYLRYVEWSKWKPWSNWILAKPAAEQELAKPAILDAQVLNSWAVRMVTVAILYRKHAKALDLPPDQKVTFAQVKSVAEEMYVLWKIFPSVFPLDRWLGFQTIKDEKKIVYTPSLADITMVPQSGSDPVVGDGYFGRMRQRRCHPTAPQVRDMDHPLGVPLAIRFAAMCIVWYLVDKEPKSW